MKIKFKSLMAKFFALSVLCTSPLTGHSWAHVPFICMPWMHIVCVLIHLFSVPTIPG